ncbi:cAMP-binding domain of CRP or a regulatory subunit of cAMP-dependent protein kinases [Lentzea fradiae]|uniref:cAMP-binding domain of CRP or a regulatory subunit of cAMP-dependent protein kinases n=1 Tax=Lentzea fradiae TaxID=200378 RepID=A0A1G7M5I5_9PSEU|nr:Crp/Fnr family transcriptional regulator [Lentzea fradiae]SDF57022.1 cAMP-binding domain of CRP or a regulatory subunit of cAMP-dependent protein kinases [Lentzea fradiae]
MTHDGSGWPVRTLLGRLSAAARKSVLALGTERFRGPGESILRQGEHGTDVILLLSGYVKVEVDLPRGERTLLAVRTAGDLVGEMGPLERRPRSASVRTCVPIRYRSIAWTDWERFLGAHPAAALEFGRMLSARLRSANERRLDAAVSRRVPVKIARVVDELFTVHGTPVESGVALSVPITQRELASLAGVSLSATESELRELENSGLLKWKYRGCLLLDSVELKRRAENFPDNPLQ